MDRRKVSIVVRWHWLAVKSNNQPRHEEKRPWRRPRPCVPRPSLRVIRRLVFQLLTLNCSPVSAGGAGDNRSRWPGERPPPLFALRQTPPSPSVSNRCTMGGRPESPTTTIRWHRRRKGRRWNKKEKRINEGGETRNLTGKQNTRRRWPYLTTVIGPFFQRVGPQRRSSQPWPVLVSFCPLPFSSLTSYLSNRTVLTYTYEPSIFSSVLPSISPECLVSFPHSPAIEILRFTPVYHILLLIPPTQ